MVLAEIIETILGCSAHVKSACFLSVSRGEVLLQLHMLDIASDVVLSDRQSPYLWLLIKNLISAKNCLPLCLCLWPWDDGSLLWAVSVVEVHCGVSVVCVAWALI